MLGVGVEGLGGWSLGVPIEDQKIGATVGLGCRLTIEDRSLGYGLYRL